MRNPSDLSNLQGFGFVTFENATEADRAREKLNGTIVEGRKIEVRGGQPGGGGGHSAPPGSAFSCSVCPQVNNATARVVTKKPQTPLVNGELSGETSAGSLVEPQSADTVSSVFLPSFRVETQPHDGRHVRARAVHRCALLSLHFSFLLDPTRLTRHCPPPPVASFPYPVATPTLAYRGSALRGRGRAVYNAIRSAAAPAAVPAFPG